MKEFLINNEYELLYWLSFYGFWTGMVVLAFVCVHWFYFHRDRKSKLSWVVSTLVLALGLSMLSANFYNATIFGFGPENYHDKTFFKLGLKLFQGTTTTFLLYSVVQTTWYYLKYMRRKS